MQNTIPSFSLIGLTPNSGRYKTNTQGKEPGDYKKRDFADSYKQLCWKPFVIQLVNSST